MSDKHAFKPSSPGYSRSPCPALNTLANHGYISRNGKDLTFTEVVRAITHVYNISYPLAIFLTLAGFVTCGKWSFCNRALLTRTETSEIDKLNRSWVDKIIFSILKAINSVISLIPSWTLDLAALAQRGSFKITHDASFVHPDKVPSTAPEPQLLKNLLDFSSAEKGLGYRGLGLVEIARYHAIRVRESSSKLSSTGNQIALGECALAWLILRGQTSVTKGPGESLSHRVIPTSRVEQWFGEEKLPDGWWGSVGVRPAKSIGLLKARRVANSIGKLSDKEV